MTAQVTMLTDEEVVAEASIYSLNIQETIHEEEPGRFQAFEVGIAARSFHDGARFARDRYEAREKLWRELAGRMTAYSGDWDRVKELRTALGIDKEGA